MNRFCRTSLLVLLVLSLACAALAEDVPRFDVNSYRVEGNSILLPAEVERILAPFTGKGSDFGTLQQGIEALELAYHSRGYHAVKVVLPEQELQGGVVRLTVLEVRIGTVTVEGNKHFDRDNIRASVPALQEGTVPDLDRISMNIRVANENPARKTQLLLQGGDRPDTTNAQLKVDDEKPWKVGLSLDDTGTIQTGMLRLGLLAQYANLFNRDHLLTLQYTTSPDHTDKVSIYNFGYRIPLYNRGDSVDIYGGYSDVNSGTVQSGILSLNVSGQGTFGGLRYNQNLVRLGSYEHKVLYGFDYRRFDNKVDYAGTPLGTNTEALPISIGYAGTYAGGTGEEVSIWASLSRNIPGGEKGDSSDYAKVRLDAPANVTILRGGGTLRIPLGGDIQTRMSFNGQYTSSPLIPGEQFGAGGQNSMRGFNERELTNDCGVSGTMELYSPNVLTDIPNSQLRALVFVDAAYLKRNKPLAGEGTENGAATAGVGIRLAITRNFAVSTDYGQVINASGDRKVGDSRWHFKAQLTF
jgi:hemolysin activation/secretion protein